MAKSTREMLPTTSRTRFSAVKITPASQTGTATTPAVA